MTATSLSDLSPILKTLYPDGVPLNLVYTDHPLYAMMAKDETFYGENMKIPLIYGNPQGRSASFANAQTNVVGTKSKAFLLTRVSDYAIAQISNEAIEAAQNNAGAFIETLKLEIDGATKQAGSSDAQAIWGDGSGVIGRFASTVDVQALSGVLSDPEQIVNFEVGQVLCLSALTTGSVRSGTLTVSAIDRSSGTLTFSGSIVAGVGAAAPSDYLSVQGDFGSKMSGIAAWLKGTNVTSAAFFGVDRTSDKTRLAGHVGDYSAYPIEEAVIEALRRIARDGGNPDMIFMNYAKYAAFEKALGSKVHYVDLKGPASVAFRGIEINGPKGVVKILADQSCPSNTMAVLQMNTWKLRSLKASVRILDLDGNKMLRVSNSDSVEIRVGGYKQVSCNAPGWNGLFTI